MPFPGATSISGRPRTIFEKIWSSRKIRENADGTSLMYVDRHLLNETSFICFQELERLGRRIHRPHQTFIATDHTVRTKGGGIVDQESRDAIEYLGRFSKENDVMFVGPDHPRRGIGHVVASELGLVLPGMLIAGDDSHTVTNGAFGALSLGIGFSDVAHVLATQTLRQAEFRTMRVKFDGLLSPEVDAKDLVLAWIARIGAGGAIGHFVEFTGSCIAALSMGQRMTICNMAVEAGARAAIMAPDETTYSFLRGRDFSPIAAEWDRAVMQWSTLFSDQEAEFDTKWDIPATEVAPTVTWGTSPQDALPITAAVPSPESYPDPVQRARAESALDYMGLTAGTPLTDIEIDQVFIGSCTNGRIEDIRAAARIALHGHAVVPAIVVPGSSAIKRQAEQEGLHEVLKAAGFEWREPGCSMCLGMNGDVVQSGKRCASTTNRNFVGRQGRGARTHLMGPAMAAAAALTGRITDVRSIVNRGTKH
jgi:3-isopropylmalate/(R)-2-methylmalate dehydratase large subunit